jgi:Family of unknown function (DUF5335)
MATHAIPRQEWTSFCDRFSLNQCGAYATLEARSPELGVQVAADTRIFRGISADPKDGEHRIAIMMGAWNDDRTTHAVMAPERVVLNDAQGASGETLEIGGADDTITLLRFAQQHKAVP